jgi:ATP/maltotriose-dependent transcriptional regulator MalT
VEHEAADPYVQCGLADGFIQLYLRRGQPDRAKPWIAQYHATIERGSLDEPFLSRYRMHELFFSAQVAYEDDPYSPSVASLFQSLLEPAQRCGWRRGRVYAEHYLAEYAIVTGDYRDAANRLSEGMALLHEQKDVTQTAYYYRSYCRLSRGQGDMEHARHWAQKALEAFTRLEMKPEIDEMQEFADHLEDPTLPLPDRWLRTVMMP